MSANDVFYVYTLLLTNHLCCCTYHYSAYSKHQQFSIFSSSHSTCKIQWNLPLLISRLLTYNIQYRSYAN